MHKTHTHTPNIHIYITPTITFMHNTHNNMHAKYTRTHTHYHTCMTHTHTVTYMHYTWEYESKQKLLQTHRNIKCRTARQHDSTTAGDGLSSVLCIVSAAGRSCRCFGRRAERLPIKSPSASGFSSAEHVTTTPQWVQTHSRTTASLRNPLPSPSAPQEVPPRPPNPTLEVEFTQHRPGLQFIRLTASTQLQQHRWWTRTHTPQWSTHSEILLV